MIERTCRDQEIRARSRIRSMNLPARIKSFCTDVGKAASGSYSIMETCIEEEIEARRGLTLRVAERITSNFTRG